MNLTIAKFTTSFQVYHDVLGETISFRLSHLTSDLNTISESKIKDVGWKHPV